MKRFFLEKGIWIVVIAALLAVVLAVGSSLLGFQPLTNLTEMILTPFRSAAATVEQWVEDFYDRAFRYDELLAENQALREQVADLQQDAREGQDAVRENQRLRELLGLSTQRPELEFVDAAVTRRASSNWVSNLTLDKGTGDGVALNDAVIDSCGNLVGVVTEVGTNWCLVSTVLDPGVELGVRVARIDENAVAEGDFTLMLEGLLRLAYLPSDSLLVSGDQVVTSGLGGVLPQGLTVGSVQALRREADGISLYGEIAPAADIDGVRYVYVIVDFGGEG